MDADANAGKRYVRVHVPSLAALAAHHRAGRPLCTLGACLACGYALPLLFVLGSAPPILVAVAAAVLQWSSGC